MDKYFSLPAPPKRVLVIAMRHLGDVLLCTPLISSLQQAYPDSAIDVLVYKRTAAILEGNPDIANIIKLSNKPDWAESKALIRQIFRQYDLAVITQTGDRPLSYALLASKNRIALVPDRHSKGWWKRYLVQGWSEFDDVNTHTVIQLLKLINVLGQTKNYRLTATRKKPLTSPLPFTNYAVLHLYPLWTYKRWTIAGWKQIADYLLKQQINLVLTGGPATDEVEYVNQFHKLLPTHVVNLAGQTSLAELSQLISLAKLYIGPDTGVTHLASATGTPTIAILGPTNPVKWTPWPINYTSDKNPFKKIGNQQVNNVYLIQGQGDCVPCYLEGCDRHRESHSLCLDNLAATEVESAIDKILEQ